MRLLDQPMEAKVKPAQELTCADVEILWAVGEFSDTVKKAVEFKS